MVPPRESISLSRYRVQSSVTSSSLIASSCRGFHVPSSFASAKIESEEGPVVALLLDVVSLATSIRREFNIILFDLLLGTSGVVVFVDKLAVLVAAVVVIYAQRARRFRRRYSLRF